MATVVRALLFIYFFIYFFHLFIYLFFSETQRTPTAIRRSGSTRRKQQTPVRDADVVQTSPGDRPLTETDSSPLDVAASQSDRAALDGVAAMAMTKSSEGAANNDSSTFAVGAVDARETLGAATSAEVDRIAAWSASDESPKKGGSADVGQTENRHFWTETEKDAEKPPAGERRGSWSVVKDARYVGIRKCCYLRRALLLIMLQLQYILRTAV